ncbi:SDR family oxidoreductase [Desulforegula conservatrix]|uniref:SDR family oxidoreductase n=1 Tax=Desulforegula conservatrix TaxID=153026 RepID=UPI0018DCC2ED|nr:SDR family oxidoreductase [Desulforegula conservatrix]
MMSKIFQGNIVITGVTKGLGRAMAAKFIDLGYRVFGCGRSENEILALNSLFGKMHMFDVVDVTDFESVNAWALKIAAKAGVPDILINNAAIMNDPHPLWQIRPDDFSNLIDVNVKGVFNVVRAFVPEMIKRRKGKIINFSSGWGRFVSPEVAPYCTSKWAVEGMTRALAEELPVGMVAIPLNPGVIDTNMLRQCWGSEAGSYLKPVEWAERAVPFIISITSEMNGKPLSVK